MPRFHVEHLAEGLVTLPPEEARHARLVRRLSVGDELVLFDGEGNQAAAAVTVCRRRGVEAQTGPVSFSARPTPRFTLAVAMPKGPRQDMLIEKCTELGAAALIPLLCDRSVARVSAHRLSKWRQTTIAAAKQSGQRWLPELCLPMGLPELLADVSGFDHVLAGIGESGRHGGRPLQSGFDHVLAGIEPGELPPVPPVADDDGPADRPVRTSRIVDLLPMLQGSVSVLGIIGPEGGWTDEEVGILLRGKATPISLGPNVLRIETAVLALAALLHALLPQSGG